MTPLRSTSLILAVSAALVLLSGCGRRGPLELPPEVQERGKALQERDAAQPRPKPSLGEAEAKPEKLPIPGTSGHRPPQQYPFFLDPLL